MEVVVLVPEFVSDVEVLAVVEVLMCGVVVRVAVVLPLRFSVDVVCVMPDSEADADELLLEVPVLLLPDAELSEEALLLADDWLSEEISQVLSVTMPESETDVLSVREVTVEVVVVVGGSGLICGLDFAA